MRLYSVRHALLVALLNLAPRSAVADAVPGPDGTMVTQETYPTQYAYRPLVLPGGLLQFELAPEFQTSCCSGAASVEGPVSNTVTVEADAAYGFGHGFEVEVEGSAGGVSGGQLSGRFEVLGNLSLSLSGGYVVNSTQTLAEGIGVVALGVPLRFTLPRVPVAISALGTILVGRDINFQGPTEIGGRGVEPLYVTYPNEQELLVEAPVTLTFSPLTWLSAEAGVTPLTAAYHSYTGTALSIVEPRGDVALTFKRFDVGVSGSYDIYLSSANFHVASVSAIGAVRF